MLSIHCIGLREKPAGKPRILTKLSLKITIHGGDLSEPWLGLDEDEFVVLAGEVDCILHMAAARPFWDNYYLLRPSNVLEHAASVLGVPVSIHRFVPARTPTPEAIVAVVGFVDEMSIMPDFDEGHFEMAPVEYATGKLATALVGEPIGELRDEGILRVAKMK
ncbi:hypothetical protein BKA61DRAFT_682138 [Leptodontidium sp. MPI-SDFR-AT-0119]|nr:hypothetical protein BKA61DRAFT_682138 [Leptodontidium sp. MPI-SDFR-AT-0119]